MNHIIDDKLDLLRPLLEKYTFDKYVIEVEKNWPGLEVSGGCVATANGTAALEVAFRGLKSKSVVMPDSVPMIRWAAERAGAKVVSVPANRNLVCSYGNIWDCLGSNEIDTIVYVATGGIVDEDFVKILALSSNYNIVLDLSHAHGSTYKGVELWQYPGVSAATWSFFATKILGGPGEGGAAWFSDPDKAVEMRQYVNAGKIRGTGLFHRDGYNLRMSEFGAAILLAEIQNKENIYAIHHDVAKQYHESGILSIPDEIPFLVTNYYKFPVRVPLYLASEVEVKMKALGAPCAGRIYDKSYNYGKDWCEESAKAFESHICLPIGRNVTSDIVKRTVNVLIDQVLIRK
jgi:aminotransferase EvaB